MSRGTRVNKLLRLGALGLAGVLLLAILACGGDEDTPVPQATSTPQPTATPLDVGAITSALQQTIRSTVDDALAGITPAEGLSASQINRIVEAAVSAAIPDTASAEEISALVETAVAASVTPGLSAGEITSLVSSAVAEATAGQAEPLTAAEVEAIVTSAIAGIPTATPQPTSTPAPTPTPIDIRLGGIIPMMHSASLEHWDVHACGVANGCMANVAPIYNGLVEYNPETAITDDIRGDLALDWTIGADGVTYTFNLHPDAKWHDGTPVTAADIVFSLDRIVDPDAAARPNTAPLRPFYEPGNSRAIDDKTVEVVTSFKAAAFLPYLANSYFLMLPKHQFENLSEDDALLEENILGSGPYKLVAHDRDISFEYAKNQDYFKAPMPFFDGMKLIIIKESGTAFAAFSTQQVLTHLFPTNQLDSRENERLAEQMRGKGTVFDAGPTSVLWGQFNVNIAPYDNKLVRQAFNLAFHRQPLIETISAGKNLLGHPFPPNTFYGITNDAVAQLPGFRELDGEKHPDDLAEAKRLLTEAGFPDGFATSFITFQLVEFPDVGLIVQDQLKKFLNIDIDLTVGELVPIYVRILTGDFEFGQLGYPYLITDPHDIISGGFMEGGRGNLANWSDPRVNDLFDLQKAELDPATRKGYIDQVTEIVLEEVPHMWMYWGVRGYYVDDRIRNFNPPVGEAFYLRWEHTWCDPAC